MIPSTALLRSGGWCRGGWEGGAGSAFKECFVAYGRVSPHFLWRDDSRCRKRSLNTKFLYIAARVLRRASEGCAALLLESEDNGLDQRREEAGGRGRGERLWEVLSVLRPWVYTVWVFWLLSCIKQCTLG